ncbi:hypothetical protein GCE9029_03244 [Grimontia celer]|uniref:Uncharacterized protein n=2 Tax=Grimontia celer TaxID=1796497 RepID=A0A128F6P1_9GAMM|nr:hypothetical protein GCE9029_03244 [Grimontia celer]
MTTEQQTDVPLADVKEPKIWHVALLLSLLTILVEVIFYALESYFGPTESSSSFISTALPCVVAGMYFGQKTERLMSRQTRLLSILLWGAVELIVVAGIMRYFFGLTLAEFTAEFGAVFWWIVAILMPLTLIISYFVFKWGEKMGIKNAVKAREKQLAKQQKSE